LSPLDRARWIAPLALTFFSPILALATDVDVAQCPEVGGLYKQNGKAPFEIFQGKVQESIAYKIAQEIYIVDMQMHTMRNGDRYIATCSKGKLEVASYNNDLKTKSLQLHYLYGFGNLILDIDDDQPLADRALIHVNGISKLPPHKASECPPEFRGRFYSAPRYQPSNDKPLPVSIKETRDGVELKLDSQTWKVDGSTYSGDEGMYQASCNARSIYINTLRQGAFLSSKMFGTGDSFSKQFTLFEYKAAGEFSMFGFYPPSR